MTTNQQQQQHNDIGGVSLSQLCTHKLNSCPRVKKMKIYIIKFDHTHQLSAKVFKLTFITFTFIGLAQKVAIFAAQTK